MLHFLLIVGRNAHRVAEPSGHHELPCPKPSLGGRGPCSPNRPNGPHRSSESAEIGAPLSGG
eukprot:14284269-Alexandrium_andersonii.AAC.1